MAASTTCISAVDNNVWLIKDKSLDDGANAIFSPNDAVMLHRFCRHDKGLPKQEHQLMHEIKWNNVLYNSCTRKLVNECHGVFLSAVRLTKDVPENIRSQNVMKLSQKYRSVLLACMEELDSASATAELKDEDISAQKEMFSEIELIWSLIEVLLFDMNSRSLILYRLLDWIQWHFTEPAKKVDDILCKEEPCEHTNYWDTVFQFVLQGSISPARNLLKVHKFGYREDFHSMDELLRKMPMYLTNVNMSWNEFLMRWRHWQEECKRRLSEGEFCALPEMETLCKILCGDKDVLTEKSYLCDTWYHLLISVLLFTEPCVSAASLGQLARTYSSNVTSQPELSELDKTILAVMELDIMTMIKSCCHFDDNLWFVSHMTDLLYRGNFLSTDTVSHAKCLWESLLLHYAHTLMVHDSLWQIGVDYLDHCEEYGREHTELYLDRISLESELKARKVLYLAKQRNMEELARSVCKVKTVQAIKNEMFGTALSWVVQSKDVRFATDLANRWIKEYSETGKFHCFEILKNLGFCMLVSDKLTFLGKYCEFHKLYQDKDFKKASSLLVSLLSSGLVPKQFQMVMLLDALPLLEAQEPVFTMSETSQLMATLEGLSDNNLKEEEKTGLKKKERLIRLALSRNLARAFIQENSIS